MNFRPAGDSSDEDDEFDMYAMGGDYMTENETREQNARMLLEERQQVENLPVTKVYNAIINGNLDLLVKELGDNFDIESKVFNQFTPLLLAASLGKANIVEELLFRGADVNVEDEGFTVLMAACSCPKNLTTSKNIVSIIEKLLEFDVDVDEIDRKRRTALMLACEQGFLEVVQLLEPLSDLEAEDNRGWTALFYAVDGKNSEIFTYLYNQGANYNHTDLRENTIKFYATINECDEILKKIPCDDDIIPDDSIQIEYNYEEMFESLENNMRPSFKEDLALLLYGMKCENLIPLFNNDNIDLNTFLTLDDEELEMLGVKMSFQRARILQGIYRFHKHSWKKSSIPFIPRNGYYTTSDLFEIVTTAVKHIVIMESTLDYLEKNYCYSHRDQWNEIAAKMHIIYTKFKSMKVIAKHLHNKSKEYDAIGFHPDFIAPDFSFKKKSFNKTIAMSVVGISSTLLVLVCYKMFK